MTTETARRDLIRAAERMFAERGIDAPSLREITRAAGQANTAALQYHFGTRDELLRCVLDKTAPRVAVLREGLLDHFAATLRESAAALASPYVAMLDDPDGGLEYVQVLHEVFSRPQRFPDLVAWPTVDPSLMRWSEIVEQHLPIRALGSPLHRRYSAVRFVLSEVSSRAREQHTGHELFEANLIDMVVGLLSTPVSTRTKRLIRAL